MTWIAIGVTAFGCYLVKLLGLSVPVGALERPRVRQLAALLPVALLAALTAIQTFAAPGAGALVLDARAAGLAAAALALLLRAPFLGVIIAAVLVTAGVRALGG
jgi:hypothetical protein